MPLDFQKVQIPFGQGLAQEIAPALVPPGKLHTADQAIISKQGSIQQRPGTNSLALDTFQVGGGSNVVAGGRHLIADGRETLMTSPDRLYTYQEGDENWRDLDHAYEMDIRRVVQGERNGKVLTAEYNADVAWVDGWIVYAWTDTTDDRIYVRFVDYETEAHTVTTNWAYTSSRGHVRIVPCGSYVYVVWHDLANDRIMAAQWDADDIEAGLTQKILGYDAAAYGQFDACEHGGKLYLVYHFDDGSDDCSNVARFDSDLSNEISALVPFAATTSVVNWGYGIDVQDTGTQVYVGYDTFDALGAVNNQIHGFVRSSALLSVQAATLVRDIDSAPAVARVSVVANSGSNSQVWIAWEETSPQRSLNGAWFLDDGSVVDGHKTYHVGMLSRPWIDAERIYIVGYLYEQDTVTYGDVTTVVTQRNGYVLEMRVGTRTVPEE